ncbi:MAG TPA: alpha/beta hydrolase [Acidimicrobiia bacterium]|nr:alpha/beta hydrolase [Acidimicrobiia bacterium]
MEGRFVTIPSGPLLVRDFGGEGPPIVAVHGLGGSVLNWVPAARYLKTLGHFYAFDLPGFGYSPPHRSYSIANHKKVAAQLLETLGEEALLIGNSMGGLIALLLAAERSDLLAGLVLLAPASPPRIDDPRIDRAVAKRLLLQGVPLVGEAVVNRYWKSTSSAQQIRDTLSIVCHHPETIPTEVWPEALALAEARRRQPWAIEALVRSGRSTAAVLARKREFDQAVRQVQAPTMVIQGAHDRVVAGSGPERIAGLRPDWTHVVMPDAGHCPQLEAPSHFVELVESWWRSQNRRRVTSSA